MLSERFGLGIDAGGARLDGVDGQQPAVAAVAQQMAPVLTKDGDELGGLGLSAA